MANPPRVGVGWAWTLRSLGLSTAPIRTAPHRTMGVTMKVITSAQMPTKRYGTTKYELLANTRDGLGQTAGRRGGLGQATKRLGLSLIHISEPTRLRRISY